MTDVPDLSRRQFLKGSVAAAAAAIIPYRTVMEDPTKGVVEENRRGWATMKIYSGRPPKRMSDIDEKNLLCTVKDIQFRPDGHNNLVTEGSHLGLVDSNGLATWFHLRSETGRFNYFGNVGRSGCDLNMFSPAFVQGSTVSIDHIALGRGYD